MLTRMYTHAHTSTTKFSNFLKEHESKSRRNCGEWKVRLLWHMKYVKGQKGESLKKRRFSKLDLWVAGMSTGTRSVWEDKPIHACWNEGALGTSIWEHGFKGHFQILGSKSFQSFSLPTFAIPCQCRSSRAARRESGSLWRAVYTSLLDPNTKVPPSGPIKMHIGRCLWK